MNARRQPEPSRHAARRATLVALLVLLSPALAWAQLVEADWGPALQRAIEAGRKTDVRVIVLDAAGRPVPGATVTVRQQRAAFAWGVAMPEDGPAAIGSDAPVLRRLNAVSLEPVTSWPALQPIAAGPPSLAVAAQLAERARRQGLTVRWGTVAADDPARNPAWLADADPASVADAVNGAAAAILRGTRGSVQAIDLFTGTLSDGSARGLLDPADVRRLYEHASAAAPEVRRAVRFADVLSGPRRAELAAAVAALREDFVPLEEVAIEQTILGKLNRTPAQRSIQAIGALGYDVVIAKLEVGGSSEAAAALNLETLLRVLYAEPAVQGIYFAGLTEDQLAAPHAALLDADGNPTLPGRVFEALATTWRTDATLTTDELGESRLRVFPGSLTFQARIADQPLATTTAWIARSPEPRIIVLQQR